MEWQKTWNSKMVLVGIIESIRCTFTFHGVITILNIKITSGMEVAPPYKTLKLAPELV